MRPVSIAFVALLLAASGIQGASQQEMMPSDAMAWIWSPNATSAHPDAVADALTRLNLPSHAYERLGMVGFLATPGTAHALHEQFGGDLEPNRLMDLHLDKSVKSIEADVVVEAVGTQRNGPSVLVIDTGVDSAHPDFNEANLPLNLAASRLGGLVVGIETPNVVVDEAGHGTHVAGIVAGSGASLGSDDPLHERFRGVYHNGRIIGYQALAESTESDEAKIDTLAALQGMDWALARGDEYDVRVVQASWGSPGDLEPRSSVTKATLDLYLDGINVVFSAGNLGTDEEALNAYCQAPWVLCVANVDVGYNLASSSSVGTSSGSYRPYAHPDVAAPGVSITASGSVAELPQDTAGILNTVTSGAPSFALYEIRTGTSMAAPHVAGAAALLLAANPDLSPDQVMDILVETASSTLYDVNAVGAGVINVREAYNLAVQTPGNRQAFLDGNQVKYAGPATGDETYSQDPITVGYTSTPTGNAVTLPPRGIGSEFARSLEVLESGLAQYFTAEQLELIKWGALGLLALLVLIVWAAGRRRRRERRARRAERREAKRIQRAERVLTSPTDEATTGGPRVTFREAA